MKNKWKLVIGFILILLSIIIMFYISKSNYIQENSFNPQIVKNNDGVTSALITKSKNENDDGLDNRNYILTKENRNTINPNELVNYYEYKIDNENFKMNKDLDSTLGFAIFYGENPNILVKEVLNNIKSCDEYPQSIEAIIAETKKSPLKQYFYTLDKNTLLKINTLVEKCYIKK